MLIDDDDPAFPQALGENDDYPGSVGMSLRDWFAGKALKLAIRADGTFVSVEALALQSYAQAQAMLDVRRRLAQARAEGRRRARLVEKDADHG